MFYRAARLSKPKGCATRHCAIYIFKRNYAPEIQSFLLAMPPRSGANQSASAIHLEISAGAVWLRIVSVPEPFFNAPS